MHLLRLLALGAITTLLPIAAAGAAGEASGDLDPTFGAGGRVSVSPAVEAVASAAAVQPDGKIVLAGWADDVVPPPPPPPLPGRPAASSRDFLAVRLTANGALDPTFGSGGAVRTPIDLGDRRNDQAWAVASGLDGTVVLAGSALAPNGYVDLAIVRYTASGALDTTFSGDGIWTFDVGDFDALSAVTVQADGSIVAAGIDGRASMLVVRLLRNGALDRSFGNGGIVTTRLGDPATLDEASAVLPVGNKIVVAGAADGTRPLLSKFAVVRYLADGRLDRSFGSGGVVLSRGSFVERAWALARAPSGKIVVAGHGSNGFRVARYLPNGALDRTFGGGVATTSFSRADATAKGVAVQADGKVVVGGVAFSDAQGDRFAVARYNDDGTLDRSFGIGGKATFDAGAPLLGGGAAVFQRGAAPAGSDRLVVAGYGSLGGGMADHLVTVGVDLGPLGPPPPPPKRCRVPRLVGRPLAEARLRIRVTRCKVGRIRRARSSRARGLVVSQRPRAGRLVPGGTRIDLVVSRGRKSR